jgi:glycosyltransferase involved in cell wall biosynthesis
MDPEAGDLSAGDANSKRARTDALSACRHLQPGGGADARPRVVHVSQKDLGQLRGETAHIIELARALWSEGAEVEVLVPAVGRYPDEVPFRIRYLPALGGPRLARLVSFELSLAFFFLTRPLLPRRAQVYVRKGVLLHSALLAARLMGRPAILEVNETDQEPAQFHKLPQRFLPFLRLLSRAAFKMSGHIIAVSKGMREWVLSNGASPGKVEVVPNAADPELFRPMSKSACCQALGLDERFRWICFVGAMEFWQGLEVLLQAMASVAQEKEEARLMLVGPGSQRASLLRQAEELGIADRVVLAGAVARRTVPLCIGASDICVAPVIAAEHCPIKVFEYLACERPVVASDIPAIAEVLKASGSGWLSKPGCPKDLAAKMLEALNTSDAEKSEMGRHGRQVVVERYSWRSVARRVLNNAGWSWMGQADSVPGSPVGGSVNLKRKG